MNQPLEIFGTYYYTNCFGLIFFVGPVFLVFVCSLLYTALVALNRETIRWRWPLIFGLCTVVVFVAVFWDVYLTGRQATKLCKEQAGLHLYRTAEAESIIGAGTIKDWKDYGFIFTEYIYGSYVYRTYYDKDGKMITEKVDNILSQYEYSSARVRMNPRIYLLNEKIRYRITGEILGEIKTFSIDTGWADSLFYNLTGFNYAPWICSGEKKYELIYSSDLVKSVLKPMKK